MVSPNEYDDKGEGESYGLKQAKCHKPHYKQYEVKRGAQEKNTKGRAKEDGGHNGDACDDHGVNHPSIGARPSDGDEVNEAAEEAEDNYSAGKFPKTDEI